MALAAAVLSVYRLEVLPLRLVPRGLDVAAASTRVLVDLPQTRLVDRPARIGDFDSLAVRSVLLANLSTTDSVRTYIARRADLPVGSISAATSISTSTPRALTEPDSERQANDILASRAPYRINVQPDRSLPTFNVYAQAPTVGEAERLADAVTPGLRDYLRRLGIGRGVDPGEQVEVEQLGDARGGIVSGGTKLEVAALSFMVALAFSAALLVLCSRVWRGWSTAVARGRLPEARAPGPPPNGAPPPGWRRPSAAMAPMRAGPPGLLALAPGGGGAAALPGPRTWVPALPARARAVGARAGDWPRTTRALPWLLAIFMAVVWLVPFNTIQLTISLPIDLKFDRLILPIIIAVWLLSIAAGSRDAPRVRLTWIHAGVGAFLTLACLSLVLDAPFLNHTLELDDGVKRLVLIASYVWVFVIVASSIRRSEVSSFLTYNVVLAALCAFGMVVEYRFHYNVFYEWSDKLLPGIFSVGTAEAGAVDDIGRSLVRGPAEVPLEAVAMLAMALPIAIARLMHVSAWKPRLLYGLAICLFMAAAVSTYRKSAFVIPIAVLLTLAYFRRRELLRLAPLALILIVVVHIISPAAIGSIAEQLQGDKLDSVATVSDRTSDYDAVRPDVWTHLAVGRGFGTYDHQTYRLLDEELLHRLVEGGVLGLAAYMFMIVSVILVARIPIHRRHPVEAPVALAGAAAAVGFLVASTLFDVMSFPHCPYILMGLAGLLVAVLAPDEADR